MSARDNREEEFSESDVGHERSHSLHGFHLAEGADYVAHSGVEEESRQEVQPPKPPGQNFRWESDEGISEVSSIRAQRPRDLLRDIRGQDKEEAMQ